MSTGATVVGAAAREEDHPMESLLGHAPFYLGVPAADDSWTGARARPLEQGPSRPSGSERPTAGDTGG